MNKVEVTEVKEGTVFVNTVNTRFVNSYSTSLSEPLPSTVFGEEDTTGDSNQIFVYVNKPRNLESALEAEDYPVLARIWDNDDDAIFDSM